MKTLVFAGIITCAITIATAQQYKTATNQEKLVEKLERDWGLTQAKLIALKKIGVDIIDSVSSKKPISDERTKAALTDYTVVGRVEAINNLPGPIDRPFYSIARVSVTKVLKGNPNGQAEIGILLQSGRRDSLRTRHVSTDPVLHPSESYVFFLISPQKSPYLKAKYTHFFESQLQTLPKNAFWVNSYDLFRIRAGKVSWEGKERPLSEFEANVRAVQDALGN